MKIVNKPQIWDLHIHTNKCPKGSSEFVKHYQNDTEGYVDRLLEILNKNEENPVSMISFTDHNYMAKEVYDEFNSRDSDIVLLPGVEIDFKNELSDESKHMIVYFDIDSKGEGFSKFSEDINDLLHDTRENNQCYMIGDLLTNLIKLNYNFLISPHAFKQGKRSIDYNWSEEKITQQNKHLYTDQFFCFWEAGGHTDIEKGKLFLKDFEIEDKVSLISFSDSNNFEKLENYVLHPPQYFNSLPSFRGLALVGSEHSRITPEKTIIHERNYSNTIKTIKFSDNIIELSPRLNAIIGGRGSGKSLLLDRIALDLIKDIDLPLQRKKFLNKFSLKMLDFNSHEVTEGFKFDYFEQSYVSSIFNSKNPSEELEKKFKESFSQIPDINEEDIRFENKSNFDRLASSEEILLQENVKSIHDDFKILNSPIDINVKESSKEKNSVDEDSISYSDLLTLKSEILKLTPKQLDGNQKIETELNRFITEVIRQASDYNVALITTKKAKNLFIDVYLKYLNDSNDALRRKTNNTVMIKKELKYCAREYSKRAKAIRAIYSMQKDFQVKYVNKLVVDASEENNFIFTKELTVESPVEYLYRCFDEHIHGNKFNKIAPFNEGNIGHMIECFIKGVDDIYKENSNCELLFKDILEFDLKYQSASNIYYLEDGRYKNIEKMSPGARTNILMEYIVYRDTERPLLIDQPEDNIDNQTIYEDLKKWFYDLKFKRQVIVVTHDANIVINSDAENIIIANQEKPEKFSYTYGAMEYKYNLEEASKILDGGYEAVERRMKKYGTRKSKNY